MSYSSTTNSSETNETVEVLDKDGIPKKNARFWVDQISAAFDEREFFAMHGKDAYDEYIFAAAQKKNYQWDRARNQHFAIYWSSLQTVAPSIYSQTPVVLVKRRNETDQDHVGRVASLIAERFLRCLVDYSPFDNVMDKVVLDYLVPGWGCPRVRVVDAPDPSQMVEPEWVPWDSMVHTPGARCYEQVWWRGFIDYFDRETFRSRFVENSEREIDMKKIPFKYSSRQADPENPEADYEHGEDAQGEFARVVEIWDFRDQTVTWICPDCAEYILDRKSDIYGLRKFYPAPEPIAVTTSDRHIYPIPEYVQIRSQLESMNFISNRIWRLTRALRARGFYDTNQKEIKRLTRETDDADLIGVENWIQLVEKGGLNSVIQWADNSVISNALLQAYEAFERLKNLIYETTGNSDVMRGVVDPRESARGTATKDRMLSTRNAKKSRDVQRIARDLIELMGDLAFGVMDDNTILNMAGVQFLSQEDQMLIPNAMQLLRDDKFRAFRVCIETDSTVAIQSETDKLLRLELVDVLGNFTDRIAQIAATVPELCPMMMDTMLYAIRGLRQTDALEASIESAMNAFKESQNAPQPEPPPDTKMMEIQMKGQIESMKLELEKMKLDLEGEKQALAAEKQAHELDMDRDKIAIDAEKLAVEREKLELDAEKALLEADIAEAKLDMDATSKNDTMMRLPLEGGIDAWVGASGSRPPSGDDDDEPKAPLRIERVPTRVTWTEDCY